MARGSDVVVVVCGISADSVAAAAAPTVALLKFLDFLPFSFIIIFYCCVFCSTLCTLLLIFSFSVYLQ